MDLDDKTLMGDITVRLLDGTAEHHQQQVGGTYRISDGCLILANHDDTEVVSYPLTSVLAWHSTAVENIAEIRDAFKEQEKARRASRAPINLNRSYDR